MSDGQVETEWDPDDLEVGENKIEIEESLDTIAEQLCILNRHLFNISKNLKLLTEWTVEVKDVGRFVL